jgi:hypothetical protein
MQKDRLASDVVRLQILDCLCDRKRRFFDQNTQSRRYLDRWGITTEGFFAALIEDLERYHIYLKPKSHPAQFQRYQFVMRWEEHEGGLLIHITLSPRGNPPRVKVALHEHDTGYTPLPLIPIK